MTRYYVTIKQTRTYTVTLDEIDGVRSPAHALSLIAQEFENAPDAIEDHMWNTDTSFKCHTIEECSGIHSEQYD